MMSIRGCERSIDNFGVGFILGYVINDNLNVSLGYKSTGNDHAHGDLRMDAFMVSLVAGGIRWSRAPDGSRARSRRPQGSSARHFGGAPSRADHIAQPRWSCGDRNVSRPQLVSASQTPRSTTAHAML